MANEWKLEFAPLRPPARGVLVVFCDDALKLGAATRKLLGKAADLIARAAQAEHFTGRIGTALDIVLPAGLKAARLTVIGCGKSADLKTAGLPQARRCGGRQGARGGRPSHHRRRHARRRHRRGGHRRSRRRGAAARLPVRPLQNQAEGRRGKAARARTRRRRPDPAAARKAWAVREGLADGVVMARDLINEPANVLYPEEFARRAGALRRLGVSLDVLDVRAMKRLGMGALLGVGQGSVARQPRRDDALERRQARHRPGRVHRQGRVLRHRAAFRSSRPRAWRT